MAITIETVGTCSIPTAYLLAPTGAGSAPFPEPGKPRTAIPLRTPSAPSGGAAWTTPSDSVKPEEARRRAEAKSRAAIIWKIARPVELHPYLAKKRVKAHRIRQYKGCLVIPLRNTAGFIRSLQFIDGEGRKRFLSGGAISGNYHSIGKYEGTLCIGEGYATCATVHEATGHATAVSFFSNNLKPVAIGLRRKFPDAKIIVCADNDRFTPGNPGVTKACEAARAVQGLLAVPRFDDIGPYDYYGEEGHG